MASAILNVQHTILQTDVPFFARTNLRQQSRSTGSDGRHVTEYLLPGADEAYPTFVTVGYYPHIAAGNQDIVLTIVTTGIKEDGEGNVIAQGPVKAELKFRLPIVRGLIDTGDFLALAGNLYSLLYASATADVPDEAVALALGSGFATVLSSD